MLTVLSIETCKLHRYGRRPSLDARKPCALIELAPPTSTCVGGGISAASVCEGLQFQTLEPHQAAAMAVHLEYQQEQHAADGSVPLQGSLQESAPFNSDAPRSPTRIGCRPAAHQDWATRAQHFSMLLTLADAEAQAFAALDFMPYYALTPDTGNVSSTSQAAPAPSLCKHDSLQAVSGFSKSSQALINRLECAAQKAKSQKEVCLQLNALHRANPPTSSASHGGITPRRPSMDGNPVDILVPLLSARGARHSPLPSAASPSLLPSFITSAPPQQRPPHHRLADTTQATPADSSPIRPFGFKLPLHEIEPFPTACEVQKSDSPMCRIGSLSLSLQLPADKHSAYTDDTDASTPSAHGPAPPTSLGFRLDLGGVGPNGARPVPAWNTGGDGSMTSRGRR